MMEYVELMGRLGESLGIDGLAPDAGGYCNISVDDTVVTFIERPGRGLLEIVARICDLPAENAGQVLKVLMAAMAPGDAAEDFSFFIDELDEGLYLRRTETLAELDVEGVRRALEKFANALDDWRAAIGDFQSIQPVVNEALGDGKGESKSFGLGEHGFMQV